MSALPFRNKLTRTRGFVGVCDTHAVLAFRGSDPVTLQTWLTDALVRLIECDDCRGRVHYGFSSCLGRTWDKVQRALEAAGDRPLFLTGHSMGGALAVLTACRLAAAGRSAVATYTFGSPRFADRVFCAGHRLPTYRVVNRLDIIPEVPFASLKRLLPRRPRFTIEQFVGRLRRAARQVPCYGHVKTLIYIDSDGAITPDADVTPWHSRAVARVLATRGKSFLAGITDHLITSYIRGLQRHAEALDGAAFATVRALEGEAPAKP